MRRRHSLLLAGTSSQTQQQHLYFITFSFQGRARHCRHAPPQTHRGAAFADNSAAPKSLELLLLFASLWDSFLSCASSGSVELAAGRLFNTSPWYCVLTSAVWPLACVCVKSPSHGERLSLSVSSDSVRPERGGRGCRSLPPRL